MEFVKRHAFSQADLALDSEVLHTFWHNALAVLQSLQTPLGVTASGRDDQFHAIFGRDSLWTVLLALEAGRLLQATKMQDEKIYTPSLAYPVDYHTWLHELAATVLRGLASLQGRVVNDFNEEQPGRIIHEYWDPVPQRMIVARWPVVINGRYYGAFDSTFLFVITAAQVDAYFHDEALLEELWPHIDAALHWMLDWSDLDQDGLVEYSRRNPEGIGLANEVWKDSAEAVQPREHEPLRHPLAWIELQGYAWAAYASYIELAEKRQRLDPALYREIQQRIEGLQQGLQRFWLANEQYPAIALDGRKQPIQAVSSNPGHLLWSGILNKEQAEQVGQRLMRPDLLTPWGVRTLSDQAYYYNPFMYHCGAVWPFDNAVITVGLQRYGFNVEARSIAQRILQAMHATNDPVELYMVLPSLWIRSPQIQQEWVLVDYFYASSIQAWTAAAILYLASLLLYG